MLVSGLVTKKMQMIRTDGWAAQYTGVGTNNKIYCTLEQGNVPVRCGRGGGGGVVDKKKISATPPVKLGIWG